MSIFGKGSILHSVTKNKCPRCQEGDFFKYSNAYRLTHFSDQHESCSHCHLKYELEPGFFYGSMYVSYAFNVAWFVAIWVATSVLAPNMTKLTQFLIIAVTLLTLYPISYRYARILYTNLFVRFGSHTEPNA